MWKLVEAANGLQLFSFTHRITSTLQASDAYSGSLIVGGGVGIAGDLYIDGSMVGPHVVDPMLPVHFTDTSISTDSTSGSLIVDGGVGIAGDVNIAGNISASQLHITGTTISTDSTSGALIIDGGVGISGDLNVGGKISSIGEISSGCVLYGNTDSSIISSAQYVIDNTDANASKLKVVSPNTNKTAQLAVDQLWDTAQTYTNATNYEQWTGSQKVMSTTTGGLTIYPTTQSTDVSSGALVVTGGIGCAKTLSAGPIIRSYFDPTHYGTMSTNLAGVMTLSATGSSINLDTGNVVNVRNTTQAGVNSGALVVSGGEYVTKDLYTGGIIKVTSTTASGGVSAGCIVTEGGVGIAKDVWIGQDTHILDTTQSVGVTSGALIVNGGLGVSKNLNTDKLIVNNITSTSIYSYGGQVLNGGLQVTAPSSQLQLKNTGATQVLDVSILNNAVEFGSAVNLNDFTIRDPLVTKIQATNVSSDTLSGALLVAGGIGVADNVNIGGNVDCNTLYSQQAITSLGTIQSVYPNSCLELSGDNGLTYVNTYINSGTMEIDGKVHLLNTTGSTNISSGALVVSGGIGVAGTEYIGDGLSVTRGSGTAQVTYKYDPTHFGTIYCNASGDSEIGTSNQLVSISAANTLKVQSTTQSTNALTGSLIVNGGVGIGKDTFINGIVHCKETSQSTSTTTGGVIVSGGMGVMRNITIGGNIILGTGNTLYNVIPLWSYLKFVGDANSALLTLNSSFSSAEFVNGFNRYLSGSFALPRNWKVGSEILIYAHWWGLATQNATVIWRITYSITTPGASFSLTGTQLANATHNNITLNTMYSTSLGVIDMSSVSTSDCIVLIRLERLGGSDTYTQSAFLNALECYYQIGQLGTSTV